MEPIQKNFNTDISTAEVKNRKPRPTMTDFLAGEVGDFKSDLTPYLPQDLIGGSVPHIPGTEESAVWNAASQACGTEKVHFVYSAEGGRVWYLACPSSAFSSNPDSWCPLASALPGNSEFWDKETVYLYEQEGVASAMRWDPETGRMQIFIGASRTILPRVQSMDANFVTINPSVAEVVPWQSRTLKTEKLSRAMARLLILTGLVVGLIATSVLIVNLISIGFVNRDLERVKRDSDTAARDLLINAANVMQSDTIKHMVRVQSLLDSLAESNGFLVKYDVQDKKVEWEAVVPQAFAEKVLQENKGAQVLKKDVGDQVRIKGTR